MRRFIFNIIPLPGGLLSHITCACTCTWESVSHKATQKCLQLPPCACWFKQRCYSACHMLYVLCVRYSRCRPDVTRDRGKTLWQAESADCQTADAIRFVTWCRSHGGRERRVLTGPDVKVNMESPDTKSTEKLTWQLRIRDPCQSD